jgi:hypothetical protein
MSEEMFNQYSEKLGIDGLSAEIVDGKFIITPAEAGISLIGYVDIAEEQLLSKDKEIATLTNTNNWLSGDNANLRDILEKCYSVLIECGHVELAEECINNAYPISFISADGEYGTLDWEDKNE